MRRVDLRRAGSERGKPGQHARLRRMRMNDVETADLVYVTADLPQEGHVRPVWLAAHRNLLRAQPVQARDRVAEGLFRAQVGVEQVYPATGFQESFGEFGDVTADPP